MNPSTKTPNLIERMKNAGGVELKPANKIESENPGILEAVLNSPENETLTPEGLKNYAHGQALVFNNKTEELMNTVDTNGLEPEKVAEVKVSIEQQFANLKQKLDASIDEMARKAIEGTETPVAVTQTETPAVIAQPVENIQPVNSTPETTPVAVTPEVAVQVSTPPTVQAEVAPVATQTVETVPVITKSESEPIAVTQPPVKKFDFAIQNVEKKPKGPNVFKKLLEAAKVGYKQSTEYLASIGGIEWKEFDVPYILTGETTKEIVTRKAEQAKNYVSDKAETAAIVAALTLSAVEKGITNSIQKKKEQIVAAKNGISSLFKGLANFAKTSYENFLLAEATEKAKLEEGVRRLKLEKSAKKQEALIKKLLQEKILDSKIQNEIIGILEKRSRLESKAQTLKILQMMNMKKIGQNNQPKNHVEVVVPTPVQNNATEDYYTETPEAVVSAPVATPETTPVATTPEAVAPTQTSGAVVETQPQVVVTQVPETLVAQTPENNLVQTENVPTNEKIINAANFVLEAYDQQSKVVDQTMNEYLQAEKKYGVDNPITQEKKKNWDDAFNARSKTGEQIKDYMDKFPETKSVFSGKTPVAEVQPEVATEAVAETASVTEKPISELTDAERIAKFTQIENERKQREQEAYNKRSQEIIAAQNAQRAAQAQVASSTTNTNA